MIPRAQRDSQVSAAPPAPAKELDGLVAGAVSEFLKDERRLVDALHFTGVAPDRLRAILGRAATAARDLEHEDGTDRRLLRPLLHRVMLRPDSLVIEIKRPDLARLLGTDRQDDSGRPDEPIRLTLPIALKRRGVEAKLVVRTARGEAAMPDEKLIGVLAQAHRWFDELASGKAASARAIARREGHDPGDLGRTIQLVFLAPDIIETILAGRQPVGLTPRRLKRIGTLPLDWDRQRRLLGFPA